MTESVKKGADVSSAPFFAIRRMDFSHRIFID